MGNVVSIDSARNGKRTFPEMVDEISCRMDEMGIEDHELEAAKESVLEDSYPEGIYIFAIEEMWKKISILNSTPLKNPRPESLMRMGKKLNDLLLEIDEKFCDMNEDKIKQELHNRNNPNY